MKKRLIDGLAGFGLIAVAFASPVPTHATGIQMLPPTDYSGNPCSATTAGLLQWDGSNPIKCVPGATGDSGGNVAVTGTLKPGTNGIQAGNACATEGTIGYDLISSTHQLVFCNSTLHWAGLGGTIAGWCLASGGLGTENVSGGDDWNISVYTLSNCQGSQLPTRTGDGGIGQVICPAGTHVQTDFAPGAYMVTGPGVDQTTPVYNVMCVYDN